MFHHSSFAKFWRNKQFYTNGKAMPLFATASRHSAASLSLSGTNLSVAGSAETAIRKGHRYVAHQGRIARQAILLDCQCAKLGIFHFLRYICQGHWILTDGVLAGFCCFAFLGRYIGNAIRILFYLIDGFS